MYKSLPTFLHFVTQQVDLLSPGDTPRCAVHPHDLQVGRVGSLFNGWKKRGREEEGGERECRSARSLLFIIFQSTRHPKERTGVYNVFTDQAEPRDSFKTPLRFHIPTLCEKMRDGD